MVRRVWKRGRGGTVRSIRERGKERGEGEGYETKTGRNKTRGRESRRGKNVGEMEEEEY